MGRRRCEVGVGRRLVCLGWERGFFVVGCFVLFCLVWADWIDGSWEFGIGVSVSFFSFFFFCGIPRYIRSTELEFRFNESLLGVGLGCIVFQRPRTRQTCVVAICWWLFLGAKASCILTSQLGSGVLFICTVPPSLLLHT